MFIYIARHAWAYDFGDPRWPDDSQRELEPAGAERYMRVVQALAKRGFAPEAILSSPYTRCQQTAEIIARHTPNHPAISVSEALAPGSDFSSLVEWTQEAGCDQVAWVGHAPDVGFLTAALVGDKSADIRFAKGTIAAVRLEGPIAYGTGELYWLTTAKSLGL